MVPVLDHPVRDGHAYTEKGIGHRLAFHQAFDVRRRDVAGLNKQVSGEANRLLLGLHRRLDDHALLRNRFHLTPKRKQRNRTGVFVIDYIFSVKHFFKTSQQASCNTARDPR
jgi:hypothetical protein